MRVNRSICSCGNMARFIADSAVPIQLAKNVLLMQVSPLLQVQIYSCPTCGGVREGQARKCKCHALDEWTALSGSCLGYNSQYDEYYLLTTDGSRIILHFCPLCGGRLPDSKRGNFFSTPNESELRNVKQILKSVDCIDDVIKAVGLPDQRSGKVHRNDTEKNIYGQKDILETLRYTRLSDTFDLVVQQREGNDLLILFFGKPKKA